MPGHAIVRSRCQLQLKPRSDTNLSLGISVLKLELLPWVAILLHLALHRVHEFLPLLNLALPLLDLVLHRLPVAQTMGP